MALESPNTVLEKHLRQAIMQSLHLLLPEFRAHVGSCAHCRGFHDWVVWRHAQGTNEWHAKCPDTGATLVLPLLLPNTGSNPLAG